jgi:hypothetical protein
VSIKKLLYDKIKKKAERREKLAEEIAQRSKNAEAFVTKILDELDGNLADTVNTDLYDDPGFMECYVRSVQERIKTLDIGAVVDISWIPKASQNETPRINGIHIRWSKEYQEKNNCEAELFVDISNLLFKD